MRKKLSHYDSDGRVAMVDVSGKPETKRTATAHAFVAMSRSVLKALPDNPKGNPPRDRAHCRHSGGKEDSGVDPALPFSAALAR